MRQTRREFGSRIATVALSAGLLSKTSRLFAQGRLGATFDEIVDGAKQEGRLVAWIALPSKPETQSALIDAFNGRFGLRTQLEWVPNPPVTSNTRAIAEQGGGSVSVDVIGGGAIEEVASAAGARLIKPYPWSAVFGEKLPAIKGLEDRIIPEYRGTALPYQVVVYGVCWNPNAISDEDVPNRFTDLLDPKWSAKFAYNSFLAPLEAISYLKGIDWTTQFARKLFANGPVFQRGSPAVASAVVTGAVPIGVTISSVAETSERKREPLKFKLFADIIPLAQVYLYLPEGSPHPNTAHLFAAWFAAEGAAIANKYEPMARPGDMNSWTGRLIAEQPGAEIAQVTKASDIVLAAKMRETLNLLLSGQGN